MQKNLWFRHLNRCHTFGEIVVDTLKLGNKGPKNTKMPFPG